MGKALEVVSFSATAPSTGAAASALTGDTFTVRDSMKSVIMLAMWGFRQSAGRIRITSPLLHDTTVGIQHGLFPGVSPAFQVMGQEVKPQDSLSVNVSGSATAGDIEPGSYLLAYDDLPGVDGKFISPSELDRRGVNQVDPQIAATTIASGQYSTGSTIAGAVDTLKANTDYAVVGVSISGTAIAAGSGINTIRITSPDWGNLGVGIPAAVNEPGEIYDWFRNLSERFARPLIPVFNSSNKGTTLLSVAGNENATTVTVYPRLIELAPGKSR